MSRVAGAMIPIQKQQEGTPSIADLPGAVVSIILSLLHAATDRNRAAEVCRSFRFYERQTRRSLIVRALQSHLHLVPRCFSYVTDLDLSVLTLLPDERPSFQFENGRQVRIARAFPNVRTLKVMAMGDESVREIGLIWPRIESISFTQAREISSTPRLETVLETFRHCEVLDARNIQCNSLASALFEREILPLKSLNLETLVITNDLDINLLAEKCLSLENLCITVHPGRVKGDCFLKLAENCRKLCKLRLFLFLDSLRFFTAENSRRCLNFLARMASELPDIEMHISFQQIPSTVTGYRMECLVEMATCIRSLVLYSSDADVKGVCSCNNLTELTFGACEGLTDLELVSVIKKCPNLHTLRILDCKRITQRGLKEVARIAKLTSLSLCFLKVSVKAQVDAVKLMSGSLTAMRLMVNGPVDSLSGLSGWPNLSRLEITFTISVHEDKLMEPWLESCPNLKHLGIVFQNWCPSTLRFLAKSPSLQSLSLSFSKEVKKDVLLLFLEDAARLPHLSLLSLFICNEEWLCEEAGEVLAEFPKLKSLNIVWNLEAPTYAESRQFTARPLLLNLLTIKCLHNVQLPSFLIDKSDLKIFHKGLHAHTMQSILRSICDLQARDFETSGKRTSIMHRREEDIF